MNLVIAYMVLSFQSLVSGLSSAADRQQQTHTHEQYRTAKSVAMQAVKVAVLCFSAYCESRGRHGEREIERPHRVGSARPSE